MLHHGDLSSSGGSLDSNDQPLTSSSILQQQQQRRQHEQANQYGSASRSFDSPPMMGELDRLQMDLLAATMSPRSSLQGGTDPLLLSSSSYLQQPQDPSAAADGAGRRGSTHSHLSQLSQQSRRERAESFRRRRSTSICSDRDYYDDDADAEAAEYGYKPRDSYADLMMNEMNDDVDDEEMMRLDQHTPIGIDTTTTIGGGSGSAQHNSTSYGGEDATIITPMATQVPFPGHPPSALNQRHHTMMVKQQMSVSFEQDDLMMMEGDGDDYLPHHHHHLLLHDDTSAKIEPPPTRPKDDAVTSSVSPPTASTAAGIQSIQSFPSQQQIQQQQQQQQQPLPTQTQLTARPQLTPRQKWLMAFNKICAQLVSATIHRPIHRLLSLPTPR